MTLYSLILKQSDVMLFECKSDYGRDNLALHGDECVLQKENSCDVLYIDTIALYHFQLIYKLRPSKL